MTEVVALPVVGLKVRERAFLNPYRPRSSCGNVLAKYMMAHPVRRMVLLARRVFLRPKRSERRPPDTRPHMLNSCMMLTAERRRAIMNWPVLQLIFKVIGRNGQCYRKFSIMYVFFGYLGLASQRKEKIILRVLGLADRS